MWFCEIVPFSPFLLLYMGFCYLRYPCYSTYIYHFYTSFLYSDVICPVFALYRLSGTLIEWLEKKNFSALVVYINKAQRHSFYWVQIFFNYGTAFILSTYGTSFCTAVKHLKEITKIVCYPNLFLLVPSSLTYAKDFLEPRNTDTTSLKHPEIQIKYGAPLGYCFINNMIIFKRIKNKLVFLYIWAMHIVYSVIS
jgi:hypothetical protein